MMVLLMDLICCVNGRLAGQTYEQLPHSTHSIPSNFKKPASSFLLANPASFAGSRWLGHPSPQRPQRIHADVSSFETTSSLNTKSEELPFTTGTSKLYIAKPIIGPRPILHFRHSHRASRNVRTQSLPGCCNGR